MTQEIRHKEDLESIFIHSRNENSQIAAGSQCGYPCPEDVFFGQGIFYFANLPNYMPQSPKSSMV
jgi:hypothetical protein